MDTAEHGTTASTSKTILQLPNGIAIREWRHTDIIPMSYHADSKKIWNNLRNRMPHPYTEADAERWINFCHDTEHHIHSGKWTPETGSQGPALATDYAVTRNDEAIGSIGLDFKDDIYFRTAEIGYWLGEDYWGRGIMSKVVPAFVDWTFQTFGILIRLNAETYEKNVASGKVLEKAGFRFEGRRPDMVCKDGVTGAELMWGALRPR